MAIIIGMKCAYPYFALLLLMAACTDNDPAPGGWLDGLVDLGPVDLAVDLVDDLQAASDVEDLSAPDVRDPKCGDGHVDKGEKCDGKNLNKQTCKSIGFHKGTLACKKNCTWDSDKCSNCGNGKIEPNEHCDGSKLGGQTCKGLGFLKGTLGCTKICGYDTAKCSNCGNGKIDLGEFCDGANLGGKKCTDFGYKSGTLKCSKTCGYDPSGCK